MNIEAYKRNQTTSAVEKCSYEEVIEFVKNTTEIECDTETWGFDPYQNDILCIQFGNENNQYLIKWDDSIISDLKKLFADNTKTFLFQNAKFDLQFLYHKGILVANVYDTFLVESILTNSDRYTAKGLKDLVERYASASMSKEVRDTIVRVGLTEAVIDYGLDDVKYLSIIKRKQLEEVKKLNLGGAIKLDNNFVKVLAYVEYCGIGFDKEKWTDKCERELKELATLEKELDEIVINDPNLRKYVQYGTLFDPVDTLVCTINWGSSKQVQKLFKELGVEVEIEEDGAVKESVGKLVLHRNKDIKIVQVYSNYIKTKKRVSSFGKDYLKFINPVTSRIHTVYKQLLDTGRMSSGNTKQGKPNLQQVPNDSEHRGCFVSEKGNVLICADYTGQEAVIFANKCLDKNLLKFYDDNLGDMHSYVASLCFPDELEGLTLDEIKSQHKDLRQKAKAAGFAIQFGGTGYTIANNLGLLPAEGEKVYKGYTEAFPEMFKYFKKVSDEAKEVGYVEFNKLTNRKFFLGNMEEYDALKEMIKEPGFWTTYKEEKNNNSDYFREYLGPKVKKYFKMNGVIERTSYNYPVQGSAADCTKYAACLFFKWILENDLFGIVKLVNIVHDEILAECPAEMVELCQQKLGEFMETAGSYFCKRVKLSADPIIATYWEH